MLRPDTEVGRGERPASWWPAVAVVALAAALRLYGLGWGLPNALHDYSYHPDEFLTIGAAAAIIQTLLPGFYNYPSLYLYVCAGVVLVASFLGLAPSPGDAYLWARSATVAMGVTAVGLTYWTARLAFGVSAALLAAVVLCIAPLHVQHSHFATVDVPSTLFVAACLGLSALALAHGRPRDYALAGVAAGLAAGTKYNTGLVLLCVIAAHFLRRRTARRKPANWLVGLAVAGALAAFVVSTPGMVLDWGRFVNGIGFELGHAAVGHGLVFAGTGSGFVYTFTSSLWYGLGPPLAVLFAASVLYAVYKRDSRGLMILAFVLPYYVLISLSNVRFARYSLPLFPPAAILIGWAACECWIKLGKLRAVWTRWVWAGACGLLLACTLCYSMALDGLFTQPDPRGLAAQWVSANVPRRVPIGFLDTPWFYSPPLTRSLGTGTLQQREAAVGDAPYDIVVFSERSPPGWWARPGVEPEWVIVSDYDIGDALRLKGMTRGLTPDQRESVRRTLADYDLILRRYRQNKVFRKTLQGSCLILQTERLPHDMRYPAPTIKIYRLKQ